MCVRHTSFACVSLLVVLCTPEQIIDPLYVCGNAANLEDRTIRFFTNAKIYFALSSRLAAFP